MSQLDLSVTSGVTSRHVSFIETGRSAPSRQMLHPLAEALDMPLRSRNDLYLAAGYAAPYQQLDLDAGQNVEVAAALERILQSHEPLPAVVMDRHWTLLRANRGAQRLFGSLVDLSSLTQPANILRLVFGELRPHFVNWDDLAHALLSRIHREAVGGIADPILSALAEELKATIAAPGSSMPPHPHGPVIDIAFDIGGRVERYFSTVTTLGTPNDVTLSELALEMLFPADDETVRIAKAMVEEQGAFA
jgi:transcriptional regulator with XRE-family HTH domain